MKALFVNGSPRKNWNTHKMLEAAMNGAKDAGAECELVHLYDLSFKGCVSCFACKLKNSKTNGLCAIHDELRPVLEKALDSDVIVVGSPVYLLGATASARAFLERLVFPVVSYSVDEQGNPIRVLAKPKQTALIFTMNGTKEAAERFGMDSVLGSCVWGVQFSLGHCEMLCAYDTYQFSDYSRYAVNVFNEKDKAAHRDEQFPKDLAGAYELGKRLVEKASM